VGFTVADAHLLALAAHEGQVDPDGRDHYLAVLRPVADAVRRHGPHAEMAALLRDVVRDTGDSPDPARRHDPARLRALGVPEDVVEAVEALTPRPGEPHMSGLVRRCAAHPLARIVALAENGQALAAVARLAESDPAKARSLREGRYRPARRILLAAEAADTVHGRRVLV
jgi:hypothetical protein